MLSPHAYAQTQPGWPPGRPGPARSPLPEHETSLERWQNQRSQLVRFYRSIIFPRQADCAQIHVTTRVKIFCQTLVDYLAAGHFTQYRSLLSAIECHNPRQLGQARQLCETAFESTLTALQFNDKYHNDESCERHQRELARDIITLGYALQKRFETEDRLTELAEEEFA